MSPKLIAGRAVGAMLGAAYGDALGWPNERIGRNKSTQKSTNSLSKLRSWTRRSGGRFYPYDETINMGGYSDDTQLILCLSRSLLRGADYWNHLTGIELPLWSSYERGGGAATKQAVQSWIQGGAPWRNRRKKTDRDRYFQAGGNGVAMRALPHVLYSGYNSFSEVASSIFTDGITTHGHPKALLGALAYGFALWSAINKQNKLTYGELITDVISNEKEWANLPQNTDLIKQWKEASEAQSDTFNSQWIEAKEELLGYLNICQKEISKGALSSDTELLEEIQCFNRKISGAGTVAAAASIYLASRYAADPINGVTRAAFAFGSDTDTIASMTGGILGCINGTEWLSSVREDIQDSKYIENISLQLISKNQFSLDNIERVKKASLKKWIDSLVDEKDQGHTTLPDQRKAKIEILSKQPSNNGKHNVILIKITSDDGQELYINKITKNSNSHSTSGTNAGTDTLQRHVQQQLPARNLILGPKIPVSSMKRSIWFYGDLFGLNLKKSDPDYVAFSQGLVLVPKNYQEEILPKSDSYKALIYMEVTKIEERFNWAIERKVRIITQLENWKQTKRRYFRCLDPDDNLVEIFEGRGV
ncbi:MAG: ADP-ribosylglycohydrolase family protein [Opitutaceae bacterium]